MRILLGAALLGMLGTVVPLSAQSVLDETIPMPGAVTAGPSEEDAQFWLMRWTPVEGAKYYRVWREVVVDYDLDDQGQLVELDQPKAAWLPWARVDALPGMDPVQALVASLDNINTRWAVSAVVEKDGAEFQSALAIAADPATAVEGLGWGEVKARVGN